MRYSDFVLIGRNVCDDIPHRILTQNSCLCSDHAFSPTSLSLGRRGLLNRTMDRFREKTSTLLTRLAHGLGRKQRPTIDRFPAPQTSPSATSRVGPLDRMLICSIPFLQSSNFQMNSSFLFSLTSPPTRTSPVTMPGFTCCTVRSCVTTTIAGRGFYGR